jgi:hypothetical protein
MHFKNAWTIPLHWCESVIDKSGKVHQIRCKICTSMEGKHKLLYTKLDSLQKNPRRCKAKISMLGVELSPYYYYIKT